MRAITLESPDAAPRVRDDLPDPTPAGNHVVVRVHASSVVDALLDLVHYTPGTYEAALKDGARAASSTGAAGEGQGRSNVMANPTPENLHRLGELLADGSLRVPIQRTYSLEQAPEALAAQPAVHTHRASSPSR